MSDAHALLSELARRGVDVRAQGGRIRVSAAKGAVTPADIEAIRAVRHEVLSALTNPSPGGLLGEALALEAREALAAFRLRLLGGLGEVWIVTAQGVFDDLVAEEARRPEAERRPIIWLADWCRLRGRGPEAILAALEVCRAWPGARVVH